MVWKDATGVKAAKARPNSAHSPLGLLHSRIFARHRANPASLLLLIDRDLGRCWRVSSACVVPVTSLANPQKRLRYRCTLRHPPYRYVLGSFFAQSQCYIQPEPTFGADTTLFDGAVNSSTPNPWPPPTAEGRHIAGTSQSRRYSR